MCFTGSLCKHVSDVDICSGRGFNNNSVKTSFHPLIEVIAVQLSGEGRLF